MANRIFRSTYINCCYATDSDFGPIPHMELVFTGDQQQIAVPINITNDTVLEAMEMFTASLTLVHSNVKVNVSPSLAAIFIHDNGRELLANVHEFTVH